MEMPARVSGVAIPIAVPPVIAEIRERWDFAAAQGAQPHVTVLFPFLPESELTDAVRADVATVAALVAPFDVRFAHVRRFVAVPAGRQTVMSSRCSPQATRRRSLISPTVA
jgi:2'-5' RNA ligase